MKSNKLMLLVLAISVSLSGWAQLPYETGFEPEDGFVVGSYTVGPIDTVDEIWTVEEGTVSVFYSEDWDVFSGVQALEVGASSSVNSEPGGTDSSTVLWLQAAYRTVPQAEDPDVSQLTEPSSALMYFNSTDGIRVYDGHAEPAAWVPIGVEVENSDTWFLIAIKLDFTTKSWDIYVDGQMKREGIGFKDDLESFTGFRCRSGDTASGYLDEFYLGEEPPAGIQLPVTPTPTPTATFTPTATPTPPPFAYDGTHFLSYSIFWNTIADEYEPGTEEETSFNFLNTFSEDELINELDLIEYIKQFNVR